MSELGLKGHVVLVTGALGTLGSAMCLAIEAAGGAAIRSDLAERGEPDRQAHGSPSDALGEEEVQAAGTQRQTSKSMVEWGPEAGA